MIDTSVLLSLARDYRNEPLLNEMQRLVDEGHLDVVLPDVIPDEFQRNRDKVLEQAKRSQGDTFKRVRQALSDFGPASNKNAGLELLDDVVHKLRLHSDTATETFDHVEDLLRGATIVEPDTIIMTRAARRGIDRRAPFRGHKNSTADAVIIETFGIVVEEETEPSTHLLFVTENTADFSDQTDLRKPDPDIKSLFDDKRVLYFTDLAKAIAHVQRHSGSPPDFPEDLPEYYNFEPRTLSEIQLALGRLLDQMWYNQHRYLAEQVEAGEVRVIEQSEKTDTKYDPTVIIRDIWQGAQKSAQRVESELEGELGPWGDVEWGMILGKISALRWALGDEWDMLDN